MTIRVTDSLSNGPEHIVEAAKAIGRSDRKFKVFNAVYHHKMREKSLTEIAVLTGLTKMQILQAGGELRQSGIIGQGKKNGETSYEQIEFFQHNKAKIIRLVKDPSKIANVVTKRNVTVVTRDVVSFVKVEPQKRVSRRRAPLKKVEKRLRVAFLSTNPDASHALRTDIEMRDVAQAIRKTNYRDMVDTRYIPAARLADFLDALNEFRPNIIHFSGHGGGQTLLFDNEAVYDNGGEEIDFSLINDVVSATNEVPALLVFNACDTLNGADIFLQNVSAVVAMSDSIDDAAAVFFATRFYAAIANGQSVGAALKQGKLILKAAKFADADFPTALCKPGIDLDKLTFLP